MSNTHTRHSVRAKIAALNVELGLATWVSDCGNHAAALLLVSVHEVPEDCEPTAVDAIAHLCMEEVIEIDSSELMEVI